MEGVVAVATAAGFIGGGATACAMTSTYRCECVPDVEATLEALTTAAGTEASADAPHGPSYPHRRLVVVVVVMLNARLLVIARAKE